MTEYIIYRITNSKNDKTFIGRSKQTLHEIKLHHWRNYNHHIKTGMSLSKLYQAFKADQWDSFTWEVLDTAEDVIAAKGLWKQWSTYYDSFEYGLNQNNGFQKGFQQSEEHIEKLKSRMTGRFAHEASRTAKLTEEDVICIRYKYQNHNYTQQLLAEEYGVTAGNISHIVTGRSWQYM